MAKLEENKFSSYQLDDEEIRQGGMLTITQRQVMQNNLAACAEEALTLEYDAANPVASVQVIAYQQGMLAAYQYIIDNSDVLQSAQTEEGLAAMQEPDYENNFIDPTQI